jgi:hypothetical protein
MADPLRHEWWPNRDVLTLIDFAAWSIGERHQGSFAGLTDNVYLDLELDDDVVVT